ncbi:hypothetical protein Tco_0894157 [Tanacetum coccineum]|uniref:DUF4283 domain-containing protein n=1 Tax=Tanacetum coccineum TaxID=301880 RepID=A0ABQ5CAW0_9ASTR
MQKGFFDSGGRGSYHKKKDGSLGNDGGDAHVTMSTEVPSFIVRTDSTATPSTRTDSTSGPSVAPTGMPNVVNSRPTSPNKNEVDEPVPKSVPTRRSLNSDIPINSKAEVKIPRASILDVHSRFGFSLYGYFVDGLSVMATKLSNPIMLDSYTGFMCLQSWGRMDYARALIYIRSDRELKEDMIFAIPNMEDDGEVLQAARVEYQWEPPRCDVCRVFGHDDMLCPKRPVKPKKPIWKAVSKKNSASSSGTKKNTEVSRKLMSSTNPFDALNKIKEGDELGSNRGRQIQLHSSSNVVSKNVDDLVNEENDSKVEEEGKPWRNPYDDDDFDDPGLTDAQIKFANACDINLHGQLR